MEKIFSNSTLNPLMDDFIYNKFLLSPAYTTILGSLIAVILYEIWFRNTEKYKKLKNMPGPFKFPVIGNAHLVIGLSNDEIMQRALEALGLFGETVCGLLGNKFIVFLTNPKDIEIILSSQVHLEKADDYRYFKPWFGDGLLISNGDHWRLHRKMIAPTFHQSILKSFVPIFDKHSKHIADNLAKLSGKEIDIHDYMSQTTVEILLSTAMGIKKLPESKKCFDYAKAVVDMCDIIHKRQVKFMYRLDATFKWTKMQEKANRMMNTILSLTKQVIAERRREFNLDKDAVVDLVNENVIKKSNTDGLRDDLDEIDECDVGAKKRLALLDSMIEMTKNPDILWTEKDVMDEVNTIMFEGHDTTSAGSSFVLCLLGEHKDIQEKVYAEQKVIFGDDMERDCTFSDTLQMNYLERVIKETLRLYPPVPVIAREVREDVKLASGPYVIPKNTTVVIGQYAVHRREDIYENPLKFDPDNFLPEKVSQRHYYSYIPFSAGPRSCVGRKYAMLMLKVLLSTLIRRFSIETNLKEANYVLQGDIILKMKNGFKVSLVPRT